MSENKPAAGPAKDDPESREERQHRIFVNLVVAAFLLLLAIAIIWVFRSLDDQRKLQNCLNSGRRNCVDLEQTSGG
jgi:hypothetical protein